MKTLADLVLSSYTPTQPQFTATRIELSFAVRFVVFCVVLFSSAQLAFVQLWLIQPWTMWVGQVSGAAIQWLDNSVTIMLPFIISTSSDFRVSIDPACAGLETIAVMTAAILAYPARWVERLTGLVLISLILQLVNQLRIVSLFFLGQVNPDTFTLIHSYVWPCFGGGLAILCFLVWSRFRYSFCFH